jgi:hypothetical protein
LRPLRRGRRLRRRGRLPPAAFAPVEVPAPRRFSSARILHRRFPIASANAGFVSNDWSRYADEEVGVGFGTHLVRCIDCIDSIDFSAPDADLGSELSDAARFAITFHAAVTAHVAHTLSDHSCDD